MQQRRAECALAAIIPSNAHGSISIRVLDSAEIGAFSWPDGRLFISRGLIERVDDAELAAAVAHELGHLISDGHVAMPAALHGGLSDPDAEVRADQVACELLRRSDRAPAALVHLLQLIGDDKHTSDTLRIQLRDRIRRISGDAALPAHP